MRLRKDTRGASITVTHALTIGITAILISGLLFAGGELLNQQQERVTQNGLTDIGGSVTTELKGVDRLATGQQRIQADIASRVTYPSQIAGRTYSIGLENGSTTRVYLTASRSEVEVPFEVSVTHDVCAREINGGPIRVVYDVERDCLTLERAGR